MWLNQHSMKDPANADLAHRGSATKEDVREKDRKLATYFQLVNSLLTKYATDNVLADEEAEIIHFRQTETLSVVRYSDVAREETIRRGCVDDESRLKKCSPKDYTNRYVL